MARGAVVYKLARDGTRTPVVGTEPAPRDPACSINDFPVAPTDPRCPRLPYRGNEPGAMSAHLGAVQALAGGADGSLYILADGALLKATLEP